MIQFESLVMRMRATSCERMRDEHTCAVDVWAVLLLATASFGAIAQPTQRELDDAGADEANWLYVDHN